MIHATTPAPIERPARAPRLSASPAFSPSCTTAARHGVLAQRLAGLALALGLAACGGKDAPATEPQGPAAVGVVTLQTRAQQLDATLPGRTRAYLTAEVRPQVSGIVQQRLFTEGALVRKGQPLYQIDDRPLRATEASAEATLARAEATARTQEANARRNAELVKIDAISRQAYDESQAAAAQARADVGVARANLETARINLRYSRIEAPIAGRISLSSVTPGALVTANQANALTTIVQMDPMYVDFTQSSTELVQLKRDWEAGRYQKVDGNQMRVRIRLDDGSDYPHEGRLQFAGVIVNDTTGTVTLRAVVPNPDGVLMPGMYVQALLPTGLASDALLIPQQSVNRDLTGRASVLVVNADNVVEKRPVELARALGNRWLVDSGLQPGERLVVDGFQRIKPGDKVAPQVVDLNTKKGPAAAAPAPAASAPPAAGQSVDITARPGASR
ncbi:efflux RND transporter periplasmic adaptor subunit [Diaphorobacter nitroreducens]|uniref:efflux RND transporter periplasmic adaptor subunit n=1 Tax=Diaphorobacter nitroreducens TaxID=164759 RepID=UPI0028999B67|nr:efflux RND transporter periplasmic adaptor subunit [Diaphorobacter nitroreducens]